MTKKLKRFWMNALPIVADTARRINYIWFLFAVWVFVRIASGANYVIGYFVILFSAALAFFIHDWGVNKQKELEEKAKQKWLKDLSMMDDITIEPSEGHCRQHIRNHKKGA